MSPGALRALLLSASLLSGAGALGLQLSWTRQLSLVLGHELPALLAVLTAFFGGLAVGGWAWERAVARWGFRTSWPASIEFLLAAWALTSAVAVVPAARAFQVWIPLQDAGPAQAMLALLIPFGLLLPATAAMGATLPALMRLFSLTNPAGSPGLGRLYAANTAGAMISTWGTVAWIQPHLGLRASIAVCAAFHGIAAVALVVAARSAPGGSKAASKSEPITPAIRSPFQSGSGVTLTALVVTGFLGLSLELLANRALAPVLEGTVYTHAAILGVFLFATALGSAFERSHVIPLRPPLGGLAVATLVSGHALIHAHDWHAYLIARWGGSLPGIFLAESAIALSVLLAPCLLMGSSLVRLVAQARQSEVQPGSALALNTAGAALAGPIFGAVLLPWIGLRTAVIGLALAYAVLATATSASRGWKSTAWVGGALLVLGLGIPADLGLPAAPFGSRWVALTLGRSETVGVAESQDGNRTLSVQGRFTMGGTASTNAAFRQVLLPLAWHENPKRILLLGVGTGISLGAAASDPSVEATGVELLPEVLAAQRWFQPHNALGPASRVVAADARRFLAGSKDTYDLILGDLFHPARDGAGTLYTREHFAAMREHLATNGIAVQWLPLYQLDADTLRSIVGAFLAEFPNAHGWLLRPNLDTPVLGLAGRRGAWSFAPGRIEARIRKPDSFQSRLHAAGLGGEEAVLGTWLAGPKSLEGFAAGALPSTDDRPSVIFTAPRLGAIRDPIPGGLLLDLLERFASEGSEFPLAEPGGDWGRRLAAYRSARDEYLRGLHADDLGHKDEAESAFLRSAQLSREFTLGYSQLLTRAMLRSRTDAPEARRILQKLKEARPDQPVAQQLLDRLSRTQP